ncbi:MAG: hypothetical protein Q7T66_02005 [Herminiimonas sp.]|uniref:hypothetical protein n=1 Tax=Herminiimonas sp. TaxID=1926289 RepID=UPI00271C4076|nr:hypothetical protein [Herminiimonas sp.]MDO9419414.1 hypothetical protein [Herminiimonas sp.]
MLDKQAIYHKTPKGAQAIANRQSGLSPKLRSLLIMVDGKRAYPDLTALTTADGDCEQMLSQLVQDGLIEPVGGTLPVGAASDAPFPERVATTPAPLVAASLPEAKRFTSHLLVDMLGPTSDVLCMKIESAGNLAEFVSAVKRARDVVRDIKGASAAERFIAQIEPHTPQA